MMGDNKTTFRVFTIMQHEEAEYLGRMHRDGWKFAGVTLLIFCFMYLICFAAFYFQLFRYERNVRKDDKGILIKYIGLFYSLCFFLLF